MRQFTLRFSFAVICLSLGSVGDLFAQDSANLQRSINADDTKSIRDQISKQPKLLTSTIARLKVTPLHFAIQRGKIESVKALLELGAPLDNNNQQKRSPLHAALSGRNTEIVKLILEKTKDVNERDSNQSTPLIYAAMFRQHPIEIIDALIAKGAEIDAVNSSKQTALIIACYYGQTDVGKRLVTAGADISFRDQNDATPLLASCASTPDLVPLLLQQGADYFARNNLGQTGLHLACQSNQPAVVRLLVDRFEDVDMVDKNSRTPLLAAVLSGSSENVKLLLALGANPNFFVAREAQQPGFGMPIEPIVTYPAANGQSEILTALLEKGADPDVTNIAGDTPLHLATEAIASRQSIYGSVSDKKSDEKFQKPLLDSIKALLVAKADANKQNKKGETPLEVAVNWNFYPAVELLIDPTENLDFKIGSQSLAHWAAEHGLSKTISRISQLDQQSLNRPDDRQRTPLHLAAENGHADIISALVANSVIVDALDADMETPILLAASNGHADSVAALIAAGADTSKLDGSGQTALHLAAWNGSAETVSVLLAKINPNVATKSGYTPLHAAAWNGHTDVVKQLLIADADPIVADSDGWTPLHKAAYRGHLDSVKALLENRADKNLLTSAGMTALAMAEGEKNGEVVAVLK